MNIYKYLHIYGYIYKGISLLKILWEKWWAAGVKGEKYQKISYGRNSMYCFFWRFPAAKYLQWYWHTFSPVATGVYSAITTQWVCCGRFSALIGRNSEENSREPMLNICWNSGHNNSATCLPLPRFCQFSTCVLPFLAGSCQFYAKFFQQEFN